VFFFGETESAENTGVDWEDALQVLISNGHQIEKVREYTAYQIVRYFKAIQKSKKEEMKQSIIANAVGSQDGKEINKYIKQLDRGA